MFHIISNHRKYPPGPNLLSLPSLLTPDPCVNLQKLVKQYGNICKTPGPLGYYLLNQPDAIEHVLKTNYRNYIKTDLAYQGINKVLGNNLLTNPNHDSWLHERRLLQPHFHQQQLLQFAPSITQTTLTFCQRWQKFAEEDRAINLVSEMYLLLFTVITKCLFSGAFDNDAESFCQFIDLGNNYISRGLFLFPWLPTPHTLRFKRSQRECHQIIQAVVKQRREQTGLISDLITNILAASKEQQGQLQTELDILDEILTFIVTGTETTATALAWLWYCLTTNPDINANLQAELQAKLHGQAPTASDLDKLPYTRMTFEETLRLYPPLWIVSRRCVNEDFISNYYVPAKKSIVISPYVTQRHPDYWDKPMEFNPENFSEANKRKRSKFVYLPFGAGPRSCIGNSFALFEAQLIIPIIAQQFEFELLAKKPIQLAPSITLRPKGGIWVKLKKKS